MCFCCVVRGVVVFSAAEIEWGGKVLAPAVSNFLYNGKTKSQKYYNKKCWYKVLRVEIFL